jgi:menaquinone-dependent protoporphyrinogen oxidase
MNVLVTAATRTGATLEIAEAIAGVLRAQGLHVTVAGPSAVDDVQGYDAVVVGSAVYGGHWLEPATSFVSRFEDALAQRPVWLFSSGPVGDPTRAIVRLMVSDPVELADLLERTKARGHELFAGKLASQSAPLGRRLALRLFRGLDGDWRDWPAIEGWAGTIATELVHAEWFRRLDERSSPRAR